MQASQRSFPHQRIQFEIGRCVQMSMPLHSWWPQILSVPPYLMPNIRYWLTGACKYCPVSDIWSIYAPTRYEWAHFSAPAQFCLFSGRSLLFWIPPFPTICLQLQFNLDQQSLKAETFSIKSFILVFLDTYKTFHIIRDGRSSAGAVSINNKITTRGLNLVFCHRFFLTL